MVLFLLIICVEMDVLGWDSCDVIIVSGDVYVDYLSFGMVVIGCMFEFQGFCVGIIVQFDWNLKDVFMVLGKFNLFFGVIVGNMDLMINCYIVEKCMCYDDVYMLGNIGGKCFDCVVVVYS